MMFRHSPPQGASTGARSAAMRLAAFALAGAFAIQPLWAQEQPAAQVDNTIVDFELDNGLQVVVIPDRRAPVVTHMLWYKVGSADEDPGRSGIAHFFEHLMFKGTSNHGPGEFSARIAEVGGRENAFTSYDYTAYFQQVAPGELRAMMEFEADRMRNLVLTDEVIETERQVIMEERSQVVENRPESVLSEEVNATLFQNHRYGIPIIGWMHEIETLAKEDLIAFYDRFYAPNNAVLIVAGDVDADDVREMAQDTYGMIERGPDLPERSRVREPEHKTARTVTLRDPRVSVPSFSQRWIAPSYETAEPGEGEALDILSEILGGGVRSRLYQELVVRRGIAQSTGAFYQAGSLDDGAFGVYGTPRGDATLEDLEQAVRDEVTRIIDEGVSEDELERAKRRFVRSMIFARDSQSGMARIYGSALTTGGTVEDIEQWPERVEAVTAEDVQAAARRYLDRNNSVTGYLLPAEEGRT